MNNRMIQRAIWAVVLLAALGLRVAFFAVSVRYVPASSDESIMGLQAKRIATQFRTPLLMMAQPYLFPLEAYAAAPVIRWLPRTAFGARIIPFSMGWIGVVALLVVVGRKYGWNDAWPAALLVLFVPPYLMILQVAYALPGYPSLLMLSSLAVAAAAKARRLESAIPQTAWAGLAGLLAGLACSVTLLALPVALMVPGMMISYPSWRACLKTTAAYAVAACVGFLPHMVAKWVFPGAYGAVTQTYAWPEALVRLRDPVLAFTLPAVLGGRFPLFPDNKLTVSVIPGADRFVAFVWLCVVMLAATAFLVRVATAWRRERRFGFDVPDVFLGVSLLSVVLFTLNRRADSHAYRYLVMAAWAFPFVLYEAGRMMGRVGRWGVAGLALVMVFLNVAGTGTLISWWSRPHFARDEASLFDIGPAIRCLDEQGIQFAYASYHVAYRITFATDERILCSQYYNERFYGWPLPYKEDVDAASRVAFVLTDTFALTAAQFASDLETAGVEVRRERCGDWTVFSEFQSREPWEFPRLKTVALTPRAGANSGEAFRLTDGNPFSRWRARQEQGAGMSVEVEWKRTVRTRGVALYYNAWYHDRPRTLHVEMREGETWRRVASDIPRSMDRFEMMNGHPVLGNQVQTIRWPAAEGNALRVLIAEPEPGRDWAIGEIEVLFEET